MVLNKKLYYYIMEFYKIKTNNFSDEVIKLINKYSTFVSTPIRNIQYNLNFELFNNFQLIKSKDLSSTGLTNYLQQLDISISNIHYTFTCLLGYGSNGAILLYRNTIIKKDYILKFALEISNETSKFESTIHSTLFNYQKKYNLKLVPDIETILMTENNQDNIKYHIMMERIDYDLSHFFMKYNPLTLITKGDILKWNLFLELLDQLSSKLIVLQDEFNFMHNDLKCNNILVNYQDSQKNFQDIQFIMCDLGGVSYDFEDNRYEGDVIGSDDKFNICKDLFNFIHMLLSFSKHKIELIEFIEKNKLFELDKSLISLDKDVWIKIYEYGSTINSINNCYDPRVLQEKLGLFK